MVIIKSFSVGEGDMFYIKHGVSSFTIIDCNIDAENEEKIINEIQKEMKYKDIKRMISTHPDEDHIHGLKKLNEKIDILNFYCVQNRAIKDNPTEDFEYYCNLRDKAQTYYVVKGCKRKWLNEGDDNNGSSGIHFLWPITSNEEYKNALRLAEKGKAFNNISPIFTYALNGGIKAMWMGDMEQDFLEKIKGKIEWPEIDVLFAPHHGRDSGKVSADVLTKLNPYVIVIGEAKSEELYYYPDYNTIKQNSAGDIIFDCSDGRVDVFVSKDSYSHDTSFLSNERIEDEDKGHYLGSFIPKGAK